MASSLLSPPPPPPSLRRTRTAGAAPCAAPSHRGFRARCTGPGPASGRVRGGGVRVEGFSRARLHLYMHGEGDSVGRLARRAYAAGAVHVGLS